jgi:hypothetical protein
MKQPPRHLFWRAMYYMFVFDRLVSTSQFSKLCRRVANAPVAEIAPGPDQE